VAARALVAPRWVERELDEELASHIEMETRKQLAAGLSRADASQRRTLSGIYGVSYLVVQRTKEIGVRVALGADVGTVTRLVLWQSLRPVALGPAAGAGLAWAASTSKVESQVSTVARNTTVDY
jgi:FtsX-like permease family protein